MWECWGVTVPRALLLCAEFPPISPSQGLGSCDRLSLLHHQFLLSLNYYKYAPVTHILRKIPWAPHFLLQWPPRFSSPLHKSLLQRLVQSHCLHILTYHSLSFFNWSIVDLRHCVSFRCTAKWFSYTLFQIIFHYRLLQGIEYNSLCCIVCPHCLSILCIVVCIC